MDEKIRHERSDSGMHQTGSPAGKRLAKRKGRQAKSFSFKGFAAQ